MDLFHVEGRLGRITLLVVDVVTRGKGVGTNLVIHADAYFRKHECVRAEVTSGDQRHEAHAFYKAMGYQLDERRFIKRYWISGVCDFPVC